MRRAERLFRLVGQLRARGVARAEDLAGALEVSKRTVYRDLAHLQASGLPIEGEAGVGYLLRPGFHLPAMTFTHEQLDALALGLAFVQAAADPSLGAAAAEARAKLQASLPDPEQGRLHRAPFFAARRDGRPTTQTRTIRRAIRERRVLELHYRDGQGRVSHRRVRPLALWVFTDGWLFAAWCDLRADFRSFRLDRVVAAIDTGDQFDVAPERDLSAFLASKGLDRTGAAVAPAPA